MSDNNDADTRLPNFSEHVQKNRAMWEASSDEYEQRHEAALSGGNAMAWGLWRIPEAELHILGGVAGKDILEFVCGAARWSIALAERGARPVGLDISSRQLQHARHHMQEAGVDFPLVEASAEDVPLPDASFDIVFCDWGAMTFCDPVRTVPEAARLLRPGGLVSWLKTCSRRSRPLTARVPIARTLKPSGPGTGRWRISGRYGRRSDSKQVVCKPIILRSHRSDL